MKIIIFGLSLLLAASSVFSATLTSKEEAKKLARDVMAQIEKGNMEEMIAAVDCKKGAAAKIEQKFEDMDVKKKNEERIEKIKMRKKDWKDDTGAVADVHGKKGNVRKKVPSKKQKIKTKNMGA